MGIEARQGHCGRTRRARPGRAGPVLFRAHSGRAYLCPPLCDRLTGWLVPMSVHRQRSPGRVRASGPSWPGRAGPGQTGRERRDWKRRGGGGAYAARRLGEGTWRAWGKQERGGGSRVLRAPAAARRGLRRWASGVAGLQRLPFPLSPAANVYIYKGRWGRGERVRECLQLGLQQTFLTGEAQRRRRRTDRRDG